MSGSAAVSVSVMVCSSKSSSGDASAANERLQDYMKKYEGGGHAWVGRVGTYGEYDVGTQGLGTEPSGWGRSTWRIRVKVEVKAALKLSTVIV